MLVPPVQHTIHSGPLEIAVLEWKSEGKPLLFVHATGFCAGIWSQIAMHLATTRHSFAYDQRGCGDTSKPEDPLLYEWEHFADDCLAVLEELIEKKEMGPVDAVGHSSGGATLVLAASRRPELFKRLVLIEPIIMPPEIVESGLLDRDPNNNYLAQGARRRRMEFASKEEMAQRYSSKLPMQTWDTQVLTDYLDWGSERMPDGKQRLKCPGHLEALVYDESARHRGWDALPDVQAPSLVIAAATASPLPLEHWRNISERIPVHEFRTLDNMTHFAPMEKPKIVADIIEEFLSS